MINEVINSYRLILDDARRMVRDVTDEQMALRPAGLNPPAWILGHLAYSAQMIAGELQLAPWLPARWIERFKTGSQPSESE